jgi:hypothetical protein
MDTHKIGIKFFIDGAERLLAETFVPMFHGWIQQQVLPEHLLIDVADYEHVHAGPGTVLVAHEANLYIDRTEDRPGLLYQRKQPLEGDSARQLRACLRYALLAASRLEQDLAGKATVRTNELLVRLNDRLHAPNTPQTFEQARPVIEAVLRELYDAPVELEHRSDPEKLFEVRVTAPKGQPAAALLERLAEPAPSR